MDSRQYGAVKEKGDKKDDKKVALGGIGPEGESFCADMREHVGNRKEDGSVHPYGHRFLISQEKPQNE